VRMIASMMMKSFQKGVGEDSDLLRLDVGVAEALIMRVTTISYIIGPSNPKGSTTKGVS